MELDREGKSYTADTLRAIRAQYPDAQLWLLMGTDMFLTLHLWHDPEVITQLAGICAFGRTEQDGEELFAPQREFLSQKYQAQIVTITLPGLVDVSSTRLRELLDLAQTGRDLTLTSAWVIARTPDNWQAEVTIDQGEDQGVRTGQCVVDSHGALVGQVAETGGTWAAVTLLTDPAFQLAGQGVSSGVLGTLEGDLTQLPQGQLAFASLTQVDPVRVGEEVVTFAVGQTYPSGLAVGTVTALTEDPGGLTRSAILQPAADLDNLSQVFVVTAFQEVR